MSQECVSSYLFLTFPMCHQRDNDREDIVDVLMDEGEEGDTVGHLGDDKLTHGCQHCDDQQ